MILLACEDNARSSRLQIDHFCTGNLGNLSTVVREETRTSLVKRLFEQ